jgi:HTTM domain
VTRKVLEGWDRFWFDSKPTSTLALVRIAFGLVVLGWTLSVAPILFDFFSIRGLLPRQPSGVAPGRWGVLDVAPADAAVVAVFVALVVGSISLALGYHTKIAAAVVFVGLVSLTRRNPFIFNAGDGLLRIMSFYLLLAPAGASLSFDRWRRARNELWEFPTRPHWSLRLMQVQLSVIYLATVWEKMRGEMWKDGTAFSYVLRIEDFARFPEPSFVVSTPLLVNIATYATLGLEAALGVLVWNRKARPWVLSLGVLFHLSIAYSVRIGFFTAAMLTLYLSFVPPERASALIGTVRGWLDRFSRALGARPRPTS